MDRWSNVLDEIHKAKNSTTINEGSVSCGSEECHILNIPEASLLFEIVSNTGGIVIDKWIRILGQHGDNLKGIKHYNSNEVYPEKTRGLFIVATDVVGGLFAINISRFDEGNNDIWYFAPDTLEWEPLEMQYNDFVSWALNGNVDDFYQSMRWENWRQECQSISFDDAFLIYPFLWAKECNLETASKKIVPMDEIISLNYDYMVKLYR